MGFIEKWIESLDYDFELVTSTCVRYKSPRSTCAACAAACTEEAIVYSQGKPTIDQEKCSECGRCIVACPVQAIAGILPKQLFFKKKFIITQAEPLSVKELLIYHAKGITTVASREAPIGREWRERLAEVNQLLEQLGEQPFLFETEVQLESTYSRRELFSLWKKESQSLVKQVTPAKWRFNHLKLELSQYYPDQQFFRIDLDKEKCTLCQACERLCPKSSIKLEEGYFTLNAQVCSGCKLCQETCPEQVIKVTSLISRVQKLNFTVYEKICAECGESYQSLQGDSQKCPMCTRRKTHILNDSF